MSTTAPSSVASNPTSASPAGESDHGYRLAGRVAAVAGVFSLVVSALLLTNYAYRLVKDPLDSDQFRDLKAQLAQKPRDEGLKAQIRDLDLALRNAYFRQRRFSEIGAYLLLAGALICAGAARTATVLRRRLPQPGPCPCPQDHESRTNAIARWAIGGLAVVIVGGAAALAVGFSTDLPRSADELAALSQAPAGKAAPQAAAGEAPGATTPAPAASAAAGAKTSIPSDEEVAKNWPRFRGPDGLGVSRYTNIPTNWDGASGKGILWKTPIPLRGHNSPIVWGDRIFLAGADKDRREVYSFDAKDGKLLWQKAVAGPEGKAAKPLELDEDSSAGFSAPTMTTDGTRVFAMFPIGEMVALDFAGKQVWKRSFGALANTYGHSASLLMHRDRVILQLDQGGSKEGLSRMYALDAATGKTVWQIRRDVPNSWSTPIVAKVGNDLQLITTADPWVIAYKPEDGAEIWRAKVLRQDVGPSPVIAGGIVYVTGQAPQTTAIRADGTGDVTKSKVVWLSEDDLPDTCSPLATEQYVLLMTSEGMMTCYDAKQGKRLWEKDFELLFKGSPSLVGNRVYLFSDEGKCWIIEPGPKECKVVAELDLGEGCSTCPAFQDGRIIVRGHQHLICIGNK